MTTPLTLITGGSRGIGAATARRLALAGHDIVINFRQGEAAAQAVAAEVRTLGRRALCVEADVADASQVARMFETIDQGLGPLTGLVNNAGIVAPAARFLDTSPERWRRLFDVNVQGLLLCTHAAALRMSTRRGGTGGAIVNLSSRASEYGSASVYVDYAASKGAVDTLTRGLGRELISEGIRVNGVRPGIIDTEIHADSHTAELLPQRTRDIPIGRIGRADEIAEAIAWLLSDASSYVVGTMLDVAGGR